MKGRNMEAEALILLLARQGSFTIEDSRSLSFKGLLQGFFVLVAMYGFIVIMGCL